MWAVMSGFVEFCRARVVRKIYVFEKIKKKIFTFCIGIFMKKIGGAKIVFTTTPSLNCIAISCHPFFFACAIKDGELQGGFYNANINNMPSPANNIAPIVICQKYFFTIVFACSWNRHNKYPTIAKRPVLNIADVPKNSTAGNPIKPAHNAINLYGIGVTAVNTMMNTPCFKNICCAISNFSTDAKFSISHIPTVSNNHNPIIYAIAPPTIEPIDADKTVGMVRFLFAIIGGVMKTSGGINKNMDSQTVIKNTNQV